MDAANRIARLTEREKECLRRWLQHKTAKEIALELGISHHAVEKRLKMARTRLGVGSSLEAARLLAEAEGYQRAVPRPTDLPPMARPVKAWGPHPLAIGVFAMILLAATAFVLTPAGIATDSEAGPTLESSEASDAQLARSTRRTFAHLDADGSGFLERPESPFIRVALLESATEPDAGTAEADRSPDFYAEADRDGDGKVSYAEYHDWAAPRLAELYIPLSRVITPGS